MAETKKCVLCDSEISEKASICKECNHYQSKYRYFLDFGNTTLALLIALASIIAFLIPIVQAYQKPSDSIIKIDPYRYSPDYTSEKYGAKFVNIEFYVKNLGDKPGLIGYCNVMYPNKMIVSRLKQDAIIENALINPGEARLVKLLVFFSSEFNSSIDQELIASQILKNGKPDHDHKWSEHAFIEIMIVNYQGKKDIYRYEVTPVSSKIVSDYKDIHSSHYWTPIK